MKYDNRCLSLHQRPLLPTQDPLVLGALRSKLCLVLIMKRDINVKREILSGLLETHLSGLLQEKQQEAWPTIP